MFDDRLDLTHRALGLHTKISRVQGGKLKASNEIRVAALFKDAPPEFLKMIVVHELASPITTKRSTNCVNTCCPAITSWNSTCACI